MGALVSYSGKMDGWTLSPPYLAPSRIRGGTNKPKETATIKFIGKPLGFGGYILFNASNNYSESIKD